MDAKALLRHLADLDVLVWADGEKLKWEAPEEVIQGEILDQMRNEKTEILTLLKAKEINKGKMADVSCPAPKVVRRGTGHFPQIYRPCRISEVYGQVKIKKTIAHGLNTGTLSHTLLFEGVSGTGKTTLGRIIAMGLNCEKGLTSEPCCECESCRAVLNRNSFAYREFDAARLSGVDNIRAVIQDFCCASMGGEENNVVLFDESCMLSPAAQAVLLKPVEDVPYFLYFIFCTTGKMIETLENRCMQFKFNKLSNREIWTLLTDVCAIEKLETDPAVLEGIIKEARGMPRNALFLLQDAVAEGNLKRTDGGLIVPQRVE